jgi:hypothetical protein
MEAISDALRARRVWAKIQRKPSEVVFTKPKVVRKTSVTAASALPAQTVRVVADNRATPVEGVAGAAPSRAVIIYGVRDHPDSGVADTDIQIGYEATIDGKHYRITDVLLVPGGVQALARVIG